MSGRRRGSEASANPPRPTRCALIFNPRAGRWRAEERVAEIERLLAGAGHPAEAQPTAGPGDATRLAAESAAGGASTVFVYGGDGTLREAAAGILGTPAVLAPLPGGTANVIARALGIPSDARRAAAAAGGFAVREMDVGRLGGEVFLMQASAGLDARILRGVAAAPKRRLGKAAFLGPSLREWWGYGYPEIELATAGRGLRGTFAAICNLPFYGGAHRLAPGARLDDRRLDLVLFRGRGRAATLGFARDLALGRHTRRRDVETLRLESVELRGPLDLDLQLDGDAVPLRPPLVARLSRHRLRVLAPPPGA